MISKYSVKKPFTVLVAVILILVGIVFIVCIRKLFEGRGETVKVKKGRAGK